MKSNFTQKVYKVVAKIPKGKTMSYKEVTGGGYKWGIKRKIEILKKEGVKIDYASRILSRTT